MKIKYEQKRLSTEKLKAIETANAIIMEYTAKGYTLTLRQLYYQHVARGLIANNEREYKKLGDIVTDGRMAGLLDWDALTDRMRKITRLPCWDSPSDIIDACAKQFRLDKWERQPYYVECWIEKDALVGVIEPICRELEIPYMACRGYMSISSIWEAGYERFKPQLAAGKECLLLYMGDHDPSGIDMTRDIQERMNKFAGHGVDVKRLALHYEQVQEFNPPPNPTKLTDSRAAGYLQEYGETCWELDALDPEYISNLVSDAVIEVRDEDLWDTAVAEQQEHRNNLLNVGKYWPKAVQLVDEHIKKIQDAAASEESDNSDKKSKDKKKK